MGIIYVARNVHDGKVYVGKTKHTLQRRWKGHIASARSNGRKGYFQRAIQKYGKESFELHVLASENDPTRLNELECHFIQLFRAAESEYGYNLTLGGEGVTPNEATRRRMGENAKARGVNWPMIEAARIANTGSKKSEAFRARRREVMTGHVPSADTREKMRQLKLGKPRSEEMKLRLSATRRARTHCKRGHRFTLENTFLQKDGHRNCRECVYMEDRRQKAAKATARRIRGLKRPGKIPGGPRKTTYEIYDRVMLLRKAKNLKTQCVHGHEFTFENTRVTTKGYLECRTCQASARFVTQERKKAERHARGLKQPGIPRKERLTK